MSNEEQIEYWNGEAGQRWADMDARMSRLLRPVTETLLRHAPPEPGSRALDIGCGGGSQSALLARVLGEGGQVTGIDISAPLLAVARARQGDGAAMEFIQADASTYAFAANQYDLVFSRFGVMFFDDPVAAFRNIHGALRPGARLAFCCWQGLQQNDWTWIPLQAALKHIPPPPPPPENAPGPFAFADAARVRGILEAAGFHNIDAVPARINVEFGEANDLEGNVREMTQIGPLARMLADLPAPTLAAVLDEVTSAVAPFYDGEKLCMPGSVWLVTAAATDQA